MLDDDFHVSADSSSEAEETSKITKIPILSINKFDKYRYV